MTLMLILPFSLKSVNYNTHKIYFLSLINFFLFKDQHDYLESQNYL